VISVMCRCMKLSIAVRLSTHTGQRSRRMVRMKLRFAKLNPAGNTTILVLDPVAESMHAKVARELMNPAVLGSEQVAFVTLMTGEPIAALMQMIGGEFCGNAARALGAYLASIRHPAMGVMKGNSSLFRGRIKVQGLEEPVSVEAELDKEEMPVWASCAFPGVAEVEFYFVETLSWTVAGSERNIRILPCLSPQDVLESWLGEVSLKIRPTVVALVRLEGITHIVVDSRDYRKEERVLLELGNAFGLEDEACIGLIFRQGFDEIVPLVYVPATDTFVWESSCASGCVAVALAYAMAFGESGCYCFRQPGGTLSVNVGAPDSKEDPSLPYATVSGEVKLVAEGTVFIDAILAHGLLVDSAD
jgi:diaminopimelate epimerase